MDDGAVPLETAPKRPQFAHPPLARSRPPRCPPFVEVTEADQLLPYLEHVARRPYNHGLNACWDLKPGDRVLLRVDNWHSELVIEACKKLLEKHRIRYDIKRVDRGSIRQWVGADEVEYYSSAPRNWPSGWTSGRRSRPSRRTTRSS